MERHYRFRNVPQIIRYISYSKWSFSIFNPMFKLKILPKNSSSQCNLQSERTCVLHSAFQQYEKQFHMKTECYNWKLEKIKVLILHSHLSHSKSKGGFNHVHWCSFWQLERIWVWILDSVCSLRQSAGPKLSLHFEWMAEEILLRSRD